MGGCGGSSKLRQFAVNNKPGGIMPTVTIVAARIDRRKASLYMYTLSSCTTLRASTVVVHSLNRAKDLFYLFYLSLSFFYLYFCSFFDP